MRSGTHLLIDLLLNNIADYRLRPLYIDLDQCCKQTSTARDLLGEIEPDAGQIIKTHLPIGLHPSAREDPRVLEIIEAAVVVTVRRDRDEVLRSLARWSRTPEELDAYALEYDMFWDFWAGRESVHLEFDALLDVTEASRTVTRLADLTGTRPRARLRLPPRPTRRQQIYLNKGLTRVLGRHAPHIDTTIHTLKS